MAAALKIVIGSTRPGRAGGAVAEWFHRVAGGHPGFCTELVDLRDVALPLLDEPEHPRYGRYVHEHTKRWSGMVSAGDAFVFVVPEYNRGYNAATKNALDYLHHEWQGKPVGFVSYGGIAAGTRSVQMLLPVVAALGMIPTVASVAIPSIGRLISPNGAFSPAPMHEKGASEMLDELARWTDHLKGVRP